MSIFTPNATSSCCRLLMRAVGEDAKENAKADPRSTGMGQRIVSAMATKLEASVARNPDHKGTRIVLRFARIKACASKTVGAAAS